MIRCRALAAQFDARRDPYVPPTIAAYSPPPKPGKPGRRKPPEFWVQIRALYCFLDRREIAARFGVPENTAKAWIYEAFKGRP